MFFAPTIWGSYELAILVKLLLATFAGGLIGMEREKHGRPAGLRTNLLVCVGACTIMIVSETFFLKYQNLDANTVMRLDPARTAAQIVVGIGFLGAGVILKEGISVRGLTTAAGLWVVAGLGMAFGIGHFTLGGIATVLVLISLDFMKRLDPIIKKDRYLTLRVTAVYRDALHDEIQQIMDRFGLRVANISSQVDLVKDEISFEMIVTQQQSRIGQELTFAIMQLDGIKRVRYQ